MKAIKGLALFASVTILITSCFDPPEFSVEPRISLQSITFGETPAPSDPDSLYLVINFKDGDGDLGLDKDNPAHSLYPYNINNYYVAEDGSIEAVPSYYVTDSTVSIEVLDFIGKDGILVTPELADDPEYEDDLPPFTGSANCVYRDFTIGTLYIKEADADRLPDDNTGETITIRGVKYIHVKGLIYRVPNDNYWNMIVRIFEKTGNGENDFKEVFFGSDCIPPFNGRFPVLTRDDENSPLEGVLRYSMYSVGIKPVLGIKTFRFEFTIKDRARHSSNTITTKYYNLDELKR